MFLKTALPVKTVLVLFFFLLPSPGWGQEGVESYLLPNGLSVVLVEGPFNSLVGTITIVKSGARNESPHLSGVSHLLEHLLFDGTPTRTRADINEGSKLFGGYVNAFTRRSFTTFLTIFPSPFARHALELQADMLFHSSFPEAEVEKEKKVVIEEIRMGKDQPSYHEEKAFRESLFGGTPYGLPVLGREDTVERISREKILEYYKRHYFPGNMILIVMGDFETPQMKEWISSSFGREPMQRGEPGDLPFVLEKRCAIIHCSAETFRPVLKLTFQGPAPSQADFPAFDLLTQALVSGEDSPLKKVMGRGSSGMMGSSPSELDVEDRFSLWTLSIPSPPETAGEVLDGIFAVLREWKDLDENRRKELLVAARADERFSRERFDFFAFFRAHLIAAGGFPLVWEYPERLAGVSAPQMRAALEKYLTGPEARWVAHAIFPAKKGEGTKAKRKEKSYGREVLPSKLTLLASGGGDPGIFAVSVLARGRFYLEPPGKEGIADLLQRLLTRGSSGITAEELDRRLSSLGARFQSVDNPFIPFDDRYLSKEYTYFRFEVLEEFREEGTALLSRIIREPSFLQEEIERKKKEQKEIVMRRQFSPEEVSKMEFHRSLFGEHPFSRCLYGTQESLESITREDLAAFHCRAYAPENLIVSASGSRRAEEILACLRRHFSSWEGGKGDLQALELPPVQEKGERRGVKVHGKKAQEYIQVGILVPEPSAADAPALRVMNAVLSTRLAVQLREKEGLAYSVGSSLEFAKEAGWVRASMGTGKGNRDRALEGMMEIVEGMKENQPTPKEMDEAVHGLWGSLLRSRVTRINQAFYMGVNEHLGLGYRFDEGFFDEIKKVTPEEVQIAARKYLDTSRMVVVWTE